MHFFNTFPLISPAAYYACRQARVPVVQSLNNPRLICPAGTFYRNGNRCEDCAGKWFPWPAVVHACYRESRPQNATVAAMLATHRTLGTWQERVDAYLVATEFYRRKFIAAGIPANQLHVSPHFVGPDPGVRTHPGEYALFIGRLAPEKGVPTLLRAWQRLSGIPLRVRGEGPLTPEVERLAAARGEVQTVPRLPAEEKFRLIQGARFLIWPSEGYYETFGLVAAEAFACGVPVIASRTGVAEEMVTEGRTGLFFRAGDAEELAAKARWAWDHAEELYEMGRAARQEYEARFTAEQHYRSLMEIYAAALGADGQALADPAQSPRIEKDAIPGSIRP